MGPEPSPAAVIELLALDFAARPVQHVQETGPLGGEDVEVVKPVPGSGQAGEPRKLDAWPTLKLLPPVPPASPLRLEQALVPWLPQVFLTFLRF